MFNSSKARFKRECKLTRVHTLARSHQVARSCDSRALSLSLVHSRRLSRALSDSRVISVTVMRS